jgi:hypothetical protein
MSILRVISRIGHIPDFGWDANGGIVRLLSIEGATLLIAASIYDSASGPITITDDLGIGLTWNPLAERVSLAGAPNVKARFWYAPIPVPLGSGATNYTFFGANSFMQGMVLAFSGTHPNPFDKENGAGTASSTTIQPGSISPSEDSELIITVAGYNIQNGNAFDNTITDGFGGIVLGVFTPGVPEFNAFGFAGQKYAAALAWKVQTVKSPENPTWSWSGTGTGLAGGVSAIAAFKSMPVPPFSFSVGAKLV